jgi:aminoglycoside 6'-N-acetyltransferase
MQLRLATAADVPVLQSWDEKAHVIASSPTDGPMDWAGEVPRTVPWREILIGEADGRPVGVLVIIDPETEETHYWGEIGPNLRAIDIWIGEEADLGRGYGAAMMQLALDRCFADPAVTGVLIDPLASNVRAHRFYERIGFTKIDRRTFGEDDCFIYRINKDAWESKA